MKSDRSRPQRGGARAGAGRYRRRIVLDPVAAATLAQLKRVRRSTTPNVTEDEIVAELIAAAAEASTGSINSNAREIARPSDR